VSYDSGTRKIVLNPAADLDPGLMQFAEGLSQVSQVDRRQKLFAPA
jgi:hypothetical protein